MFPGVVSSLRVGRPRSLSAVEKALQGDRRLVLVAQRRAEVEEAAPGDLYDVGVISEIRAAPGEAPDGVRIVVAGGMRRCRIIECAQLVPYIAAKVEPVEEPAEEVPAALRKRVKDLFAVLAEPERQLFLEGLPETMALDDVIAFYLDLPVEDKQRLLAEPSVLNRYRMLLPVLETESEIARTGRQIWRTTRERFTEKDRDRYLREQKEEIEQQLAELEGKGSEALELRERLKKADLPDEARQEAEREMARLRRMTPGEPEYAVAEDYLDWLLSLPWHAATEAAVDLERARQVLDRDHYDRAELKERILEYLSVRKLNPGREGALLCFVGAPGVGKTSMGRSIAEATGRKFYRVALGGIDDEAEIRGHRRTYVGALPGCIIRAMRRIAVGNPVIMLDEVDKLVGGLRGDPTSALLEVLDPEQNKAFVDNYIAVPFDLSHVMFIGTANTEDTIPPALLDRLEVIELPGYTTEEKIEIARRYLWPKQLDATGLKGESLEIAGDALELLVEQYTREAGVRGLERQVASICRKLAKEQMGGSYHYRRVDKDGVAELLGPPLYYPERSEKFSRPGVCPTLAVSWAGAGLLLVEVIRVEGTGKLIVTGRVGDILRESTALIFSYWKARAAQYGYDPELFGKSDFHVNFPSAERPKEGTSAGLAIALAFGSLLRDTPLPERTAAVGEVTLRGRVLAVDRLAERLAAAQRAGIVHVLVPARNRPDVEGAHDRELPPELRITYVTTLDEAVRIALPSAQPAVH
jgi:ATP-dependent Lon protease